ncbi:hypothetical protein BKA80DRAFT_77682 [Phyllosticta citrichinensis]
MPPSSLFSGLTPGAVFVDLCLTLRLLSKATAAVRLPGVDSCFFPSMRSCRFPSFKSDEEHLSVALPRCRCCQRRWYAAACSPVHRPSPSILNDDRIRPKQTRCDRLGKSREFFKSHQRRREISRADAWVGRCLFFHSLLLSLPPAAPQALTRHQPR